MILKSRDLYGINSTGLVIKPPEWPTFHIYLKNYDSKEKTQATYASNREKLTARNKIKADAASGTFS